MEKEFDKYQTFNDYANGHPHKPYEQSEKWSDYDQRVSDHYNSLYAEWIRKRNSNNDTATS